ncbi:MAG: DUF998 domain-containing protein [Actinomycetota bacterium]
MSTSIDRAPKHIRRGPPTKRAHEARRRVLLACGIGASLFYLAALVLGPMSWEGYSSMDHTVSELFAIDAPSRPIVVSLLFVSGVLALAFAVGVLWSAGQNRALRIAGWALLGVGVVDQAGPYFPMHTREVVAAGGSTFSDTMHISLTIVLSLLFLLAMGFGAAAFGRRFRVYSVATILTLVVFGALTSMHAGALAANEPTPWQGFYERVNIGAYLLWMTVLAAMLIPHRVTAHTSKERSGALGQDPARLRSDVESVEGHRR